MAIITISREMGSGGQIIARKLAEKLNYTLIDGEAILNVATKYGLTADAVEKADEKPPAFIESLDSSLEVDMYRIEQIILEYALKGNVIIYGRGGQDLLNGINNVFRVRIVAPFETRVERWAEREWIDPELSRILVCKSDQQRAGFIKYYFNRDWNDTDNYELTINTMRISIDKAVEMICIGIEAGAACSSNNSCHENLKNLIMCKKIELEILKSDIIHGYHMQVSIKDGRICLMGHVHSEEERREIYKVLQQQAPNYTVSDQLKVFAYHINPKEG